LAEPEIASPPRPSSAPRRAWTIAAGASVVAITLAAAVLPAAADPFRRLVFLLVMGLFQVSVWLVM